MNTPKLKSFQLVINEINFNQKLEKDYSLFAQSHHAVDDTRRKDESTSEDWAETETHWR